MLLVQQLCHAFLCEKAYNKYSISTITYTKSSKLSSLLLNMVILSLVIVNKTSMAYWYDIYFVASWSVIDSFIYRFCLPIDDVMYRSADLCWALGGIICNFIPILLYFQHWGDEPQPRFCSGEQIKWRPKKRSFQKMKHFFPQIQVDTHTQMHTRVKLLGGMNT